MPFTTSDLCKIFFAIFVPPIGVFLERGCGADLLINIVLLITTTMPFTTSDICKIFFAIFIPPIGVFLERGCGADLLINIVLVRIPFLIMQ
ncbi:hypothetical protein A7U60_g8915 [Sanghuangporus baumii]|uniref:Plasma membrane proteolipid 3 n=1 Tax=Sanghuangporus baumii TaxID=108892 RepID=A0A9Q5HQP5_SANBA|nr:hypothetical protein A7U60_g8915 [Sanghuangporus baumii]